MAVSQNGSCIHTCIHTRMLTKPLSQRINPVDRGPQAWSFGDSPKQLHEAEVWWNCQAYASPRALCLSVSKHERKLHREALRACAQHMCCLHGKMISKAVKRACTDILPGKHRHEESSVQSTRLLAIEYKGTLPGAIPRTGTKPTIATAFPKD